MDTLALYLAELEARNLLPANIEVAEWFDWTIVSCFDTKSSHYISESVRMGIDRNRKIAFMKALTEHCERILSRNTLEKNITSYGRSDGFAAYPILEKNFEEANRRGRENAFNEAVERFLWATWWDKTETAFTILPHPVVQGSTENLIKQFNLEFIKEILVKDVSGVYCLSILLAKIKNGGYVTGGACSLSEDNHRYTQAYGELLRHLFVTQKNPEFDLTGASFYEQRLFLFASGKLNQIVENRIGLKGSSAIVLPDLILDTSVKHEHSDLIYLHRCYFENQPIFMGGDVERLCI
ncbi:hypothetical protein CIK05_11975 [Bdellovibrio sp. qaytius]|nr:hypothetical protein CIK05_11975 [Bdellovibrio sp. qaytius]